MKIGLEVEGKWKRLLTLFVSSEEAVGLPDRLANWGQEIEIPTHLYLSDPSGVVDLDSFLFSLDNYKFLQITVETERLPVQVIDPRVSIMFKVASFDPLIFTHAREFLNPVRDQIKFEFGTQNVLVFRACDAMYTLPSEFLNDLEL